jgi:N-acetylmuramic acid 6-phosphate etherase
MNNADEFLKNKQLFQLGDLPTETPHPKTTNLSTQAKQDVEMALKIMNEVDLEALRKIGVLKNQLKPVFEAIADTLEAGHRIYLVGCGATGRLSLSLEYLWRRKNPGNDQVYSLMAGGDVALVHSLEGFEDFPEYGARHLQELGFGANDLLIGTTEGGETPYVIGAVEEAAKTSRRSPLFLHCNTPSILIDKVERSKRVLANPKIKSFSLDTGPMALTGSTRMQASTVLMLVVGLALEYGRDQDTAFQNLESWIRYLENTPVAMMKSLIYREAETYQEGNYTCYSADEFAITVFTDTTERAPTFNLAPFDNPKHPTTRHSLTYCAILGTQNSRAAWHQLLARDPRPLEWPEIHKKATGEYLCTFDFSMNAMNFRQELIPNHEHFEFSIKRKDTELVMKFREIEEHVQLPGMCALFDQLTAKMLLNMHSTLVMGRLDRFEGNLMTWVYPSNGKLVDRAARYTQILLQRQGLAFSYEEIVRAQFAAKAELTPKDSIIHKSIEKLTGSSGRTRPLGSLAPR